jgi:hypothetical protein
LINHLVKSTPKPAFDIRFSRARVDEDVQGLLTNRPHFRLAHLERPMRRSAFAVTIVLLGAHPAAAEVLTVNMDQSAAVRLSAPARSVVIGNPAIADVSMLDARNLVVLGKAYGITNLLVMDARGRMILDRQIVVASSGSAMSYYKGGEVKSYACAERCEPVASAAETGAAPAQAAP